ncbi:hypothetical protein [Roseovarius nanhaiticus]|uniref:hypothetical protein n=1 Tax=Roseovarius nanhaiticus TaxID=573024 RepID=UPI001113C1DA|nr:hypothetical protein [Roseovarius nanhaiticus]
MKLIVARTPKWHSLITRRFENGLIKHWGETTASHVYPPITLPASVCVGQETKFAFPQDVSWFEENEKLQIGLADIFGRTHWVRKKEMRKLKSDLESKPS